MTYENLPEVLQNIAMYNFQVFSKLFIIGCVIVFSLYYIFFRAKEYKKSPYAGVCLLRGFFYLTSFTNVFLFPLGVFFFFPQFDYEILLRMLITFYTIFFVVISVIFILNLMFLSPLVVLKYVGYDPLAEKTNKVLNDLERLGLNLRANFKIFKK